VNVDYQETTNHALVYVITVVAHWRTVQTTVMLCFNFKFRKKHMETWNPRKRLIYPQSP